MATIAKMKVNTPWDASGTRLYQWLNMANGDDGDPLILPVLADKSVQVKGTFGAGGTIIIEGSNDRESPEWATLSDPQGDLISITAAGVVQILECVYQIRPRVTSGDGTTDLDVCLLSRVNP